MIAIGACFWPIQLLTFRKTFGMLHCPKTPYWLHCAWKSIVRPVRALFLGVLVNVCRLAHNFDAMGQLLMHPMPPMLPICRLAAQDRGPTCSFATSTLMSRCSTTTARMMIMTKGHGMSMYDDEEAARSEEREMQTWYAKLQIRALSARETRSPSWAPPSPGSPFAQPNDHMLMQS